MRFRLGGWTVAVVLVLSGCGVDDGSEHPSPVAGTAATELAQPELVSARDTLPPAPPSPPSTTSLTVVLTHDGEAGDPGLDAAAGALAQRPDIRVVIAVPGAPATGATTMSGLPVTPVDAGGSALVDAATAAAGVEPDLVVVGIRTTSELGGSEPIASAAATQGIPALVVEVEDGDIVDLAAAAMQLLEVLDLELDALLDEPAAVHRLTVPSCRDGSLRGRLDVRATPETRMLTASDCLSTDRTVPGDEQAAVGTGHASLARLP
jgi:hypothetical protein